MEYIDGYILKYKNEDFIVKEIPKSIKTVEICEALFTVIEVTKNGINTFDLGQIIATYFKINYKDVQYSGLKDEDGITTQLISLRRIIDNKDISEFNNEFCNNIVINQLFGYTKEPVEIGKLLGNQFEVTVRNIDKNDREQFISKYKGSKIQVPVINYYDNQRFGLPNSIKNTHIIGQAIQDSRWEDAFDEYMQSGNSNEKKKRLMDFVNELCDHEEAFYNAFDKREIAFYKNSYMSYLWNLNVIEYLNHTHNLDSLKEYNNKVMQLVFPKYDENASREMIPLSNELEYQYFNSNSLKKTITKKRTLVNYVIVYFSEFEEDEHHPDKYKIKFDFVLNSGSYATILIKQILS